MKDAKTRRNRRARNRRARKEIRGTGRRERGELKMNDRAISTKI